MTDYCVFERQGESNVYHCKHCGFQDDLPPPVQLPIYRLCRVGGPHPPCIFLGAATGEVELVKCETCRGNVRKKYPIYACLCPSHAAAPTTHDLACRQCKDYVAQ